MLEKRNYPRDKSFEWIRLRETFKKAFLPLLTPAIIIGGIATGAFTPTESAVAAVMYSLFLGMVVYKALTFKHLIKIIYGNNRNNSCNFINYCKCCYFRMDFCCLFKLLII